ncbi:MAG: hypothetical protein WCQ90_07645 [Deltaproteobacteria bacterium]
MRTRYALTIRYPLSAKNVRVAAQASACEKSNQEQKDHGTD